MHDITLLDAPTLDNQTISSKFICVCCNCDRVRMRSGEWVNEPTPLSGERRTHGLCPDCFAKLYPEFSDLGVR